MVQLDEYHVIRDARFFSGHCSTLDGQQPTGRKGLERRRQLRSNVKSSVVRIKLVQLLNRENFGLGGADERGSQ